MAFSTPGDKRLAFGPRAAESLMSAKSYKPLKPPLTEPVNQLIVDNGQLTIAAGSGAGALT